MIWLTLTHLMLDLVDEICISQVTTGQYSIRSDRLKKCIVLLYGKSDDPYASTRNFRNANRSRIIAQPLYIHWENMFTIEFFVDKTYETWHTKYPQPLFHVRKISTFITLLPRILT